MIVSGLKLQKKKTQQKIENKQKQKQGDYQTRPFSSELPEIHSNKQFSLQKFGNKILEKEKRKKQQQCNNMRQQERQKYQNGKERKKERDLSLKKQKTKNKIEQKRNFSSNKYFLQQQDQNKNSRKLIKKVSQESHSRQQSDKLQIKTNEKGKSWGKTTKVTGSYKKLDEIQKRKDKKMYQQNKVSEQNGSNKNLKSKNKQPTKNSSKLLLFQQAQKQKISKYFRYYPMIIIQTCGKRQVFMKSLTQKGGIQTWNTNKLSIPKSNNKIKTIDYYQPWTKLIKIANLKGKYKFRQKFNFIYSAQLKALNFKRKQTKKKKESDSSSSDDQDKKQKYRDMETWKKVMGAQGARVFIIKGKYTDLRNSLLQRGWIQNPDKHSSFFDFKWTTKINDITFESLKSNQIVNHFNNNACLTSKYGICKSLRSVMYSQQIDIDCFFPKAFDLTDSSDFQNFIEVYKWIFCQSLLKRFLSKQNQIALQIIKLSYIITSRRVVKAQTLIQNTVNQRYCVASIEQWIALTEQNKKQFKQFQGLFQCWGINQSSTDQLRMKVQKLIQKLKHLEPQYQLNGLNNTWIVKPAFLSRGRGIKCLSKFNDILNYSLGKQTQYVVQKYIQNPLIINKRKFDIRQWVIVQDYNPPKIWIYGEFYLRFCLQQYDQKKIANKYAHLTNNSIQKYNKNFSPSQLKQCLKTSMWSQQQFVKFIEENYPPNSFKMIINKMKEIIIATILSTQDQVYGRRNSFQLIGYDFMIDDDLNPWLIEINTSPAMDYSTPVTGRLVKMVMEDTVKLVIDKKKTKKKTAGLFKCVYNGEQRFVSKYYNVIKQKNIEEEEKKTD